MKTPNGIDCEFYYTDYYRGRNSEECRLIGKASTSERWSVALCKNCPVPGILRANACKHMVLSARVENTFFGLKKTVKVGAYCTKSKRQVLEPHIGCGECHPLPEAYRTTQ